MKIAQKAEVHIIVSVPASADEALVGSPIGCLNIAPWKTSRCG